MAFSVKKAEKFIKSADLSGIPLSISELSAEEDAGKIFDKAKNQALVVGSGVFAFAKGVDAEVREAISASALLAQLVANKRAPKDKPLKWFEEYSSVLQNIGWTLQSKDWTDYTAKGTAVEVHEKIIEVMTVALGPSVAATAILAATVKALRGMNSGSSWFTIFSRESQKAKIARFQVGLVETGPDSDVFVSLLGCLIKAENAYHPGAVFQASQLQRDFQSQQQQGFDPSTIAGRSQKADLR